MYRCFANFHLIYYNIYLYNPKGMCIFAVEIFRKNLKTNI